MLSAEQSQSPAELAAEARRLRLELRDLRADRDALARQVATLTPDLAAARLRIPSLEHALEAAQGKAHIAQSLVASHSALVASSLPESLQFDALVEALVRWRPGRLLTVEMGCRLRALGPKELPEGPMRKTILAGAEALHRLGRIPFLVLAHQVRDCKPLLVSLRPGSAESIRAQLHECVPQTAAALECSEPLLTVRNKVAVSVTATVVAVDGNTVVCEGEGGFSIGLGRGCFGPCDVAPGLDVTITVIVDPHVEHAASKGPSGEGNAPAGPPAAAPGPGGALAGQGPGDT